MKAIKILFIEDSNEDFILLTRSIRQSGMQLLPVQVRSITELQQALKEPWDLVLSDYNLTGFDAFHVLKILSQEGITAPTIVVSGAVKEEDAADLMRLGAKDFVRKDNHARLVPAIIRELNEADQRRARVLAENALESNQEFVSKILMSTQDSILILDRFGKIISDAMGSSAHGFAGLDLIGRTFGELWYRLDDQLASVSAIQDAREGRVGKFVGLRLGEGGWWNVVVTPISGSQNEDQRLLVVARDVTEERRTQDELKRQAGELKAALAQAESANQMKTAFLANMSHEIRTPIGAMMGFSELLTDGSLNAEERTRFSEVVKRNGENLLRLLNEILDLSKIEAGHLGIEPSDVSLETVVMDVIASVKNRANEKNLQLKLYRSSDIDCRLRTDPTRLNQILGNLLGNAIKFTESGEVSLTISREKSMGTETISFIVKDSGIGIPPEDQLKLFKPFSQGDNSLSRRFGGTGLGLALSKKLAQALGGDVVILSSLPGVGSEFRATVQNQI